MSAFYDKMQDTARKLLARFGASVTINVLTGNNYDGVTFQDDKTYSDTSGNGVFLNINKTDMQNTLVLTTDTKLIIENLSIEPTIDSTVTRNGELLKVIAIEPLNPAETNLIYTIMLRK